MFKNNRKSLVLMLLALVIVLAACGQKPAAVAPQNGGGQESAAKETKLDQIKKAGKLVVGTSADYPPYEFHKEVNKKDEIVGFDIEIAKALAKDLGVPLEVKDMKFDGLLAALEAGNVDFVISGMTPTPERQKSVDFTKIYYTAVQKVVVRAEDKDKYKSIDDLKGKKVGAQKGATQETIVKEQMPNSDLKALSKISDLMLDLKNKKTDALVVELPVATAYLSKNPDLVLSDIKIENPDSGSAIAVKKGSPELVEAMNKSLEKLVNEKAVDKLVIEANELVE
ncbi:ABC transporter substrate-binding protein [Paenibacillus rigui]|uniref:Amino acid ABC transporter n=1 Tax=Paenibacillus rigui TaxID=554312 RepID=A0A229UWK0_9BACL|nr:ABC transporter substrate-binding protein [Paenibacillus rigui]OXM87798.1 amino acid ABC transporter [Paenibacillus rigui]